MSSPVATVTTTVVKADDHVKNRQSKATTGVLQKKFNVMDLKIYNIVPSTT